MSTENGNKGKFGTVKLGLVELEAHLEQLNKALPKARGIVVFIMEEVEGKTTIHAYTHGHVLPMDFKDVIDYSVIRIVQSVPIAVLPIPIENIEQTEQMS